MSGLGLALVVGCIACGLSGAELLSPSETVFEAQCEGSSLEITYAHERTILLEVRDERAYGTWRGDEFAIDTEPMPRHLRAWPGPASQTHEGQTDGYVHFFLGAVDAAPALERCLEANQAAIISTLDTRIERWAPFTGRGRVYWRGQPASLVPELTHEGRTIELRRDGVLWLRRGNSGAGSSVGFVETHADTFELRCCERHVDLDASALARFVDDDGMNVIDRLRVPVTSCAVPGRSYTACRR